MNKMSFSIESLNPHPTRKRPNILLPGPPITKKAVAQKNLLKGGATTEISRKKLARKNNK